MIFIINRLQLRQWGARMPRYKAMFNLTKAINMSEMDLSCNADQTILHKKRVMLEAYDILSTKLAATYTASEAYIAILAAYIAELQDISYAPLQLNHGIEHGKVLMHKAARAACEKGLAAYYTARATAHDEAFAIYIEAAAASKEAFEVYEALKIAYEEENYEEVLDEEVLDENYEEILDEEVLEEYYEEVIVDNREICEWLDDC